jgi:plasmid stabilization system protein ParE
MTRRVIKKPRAERDLLDHFIFIGRRNPDAAERFLTAAESAFAQLARFTFDGTRLGVPVASPCRCSLLDHPEVQELSDFLPAHRERH